MSQNNFLRIIFAILITSFVAQAQSLSQRIEKVITASKLSRSDLGLAVSNLSGDLVYQLNADRKMSPASLSKIPTAITALEVLTPNFEFSTQIWIDGKIKDGILEGDIYLKGLGEPAFVSERMWFLVNAFMRNEIKSITGDLIVDESYFDSIRADKDRLPPSEGRAFDAPISALSFNWNSVNVFVRPGKPGGPAKVLIDPINDYIVEVINQTHTNSKGPSTIEVKPIPVKKNGVIVGDKLIVEGTIAAGAKEVVKYRSISEPDLWTGSNFKEFLRQRGIVVQGKIKKGKVPSQAVVLVEDPGENLRNAVIDMGKYSNNFIAEMLTKTLSINAGASQGNMAQGIEVIIRTMEKIGIPRNEFGFASPSGLSKVNQMTAHQFIKLLKYASQAPYAPEFWSALPLAGMDGTLKGRMKGLRVRAKTGLLTGVSGLSGMALRPDGSAYLFALLYNGKQYFEARDFFDRICAELTK